MKESFVFYRSFYEALQNLDDKSQLELMHAIFDYSFNGTTPEMSPTIKAIFTLMKANMDKANERYEKSVENGKKGGAPKGNINAQKQPKTTQNNLKVESNSTENNLKVDSKTTSLVSKTTKNNLNDNVNDNDNDNVNDDVDDNVKKTSSASASTPSAIVFNSYVNNINQMPTIIEIQQLESYQKELPDDLICYAIEKAVENKSRTLAYIKGILNSWIAKGITTLAEAKEERPQKAKLTVLDNKYYAEDDKYGDLDQYYRNFEED